MQVVFLPELGQRESKALTSRVGLAPWSRARGTNEASGRSGAVGPPCAKPCGQGTVDVDKGYTEAYTDSKGERHGDWLSEAGDARKIKGERRHRLREVEKQHRETRNVKKADRLRRRTLGHRKWDRRPSSTMPRYGITCARSPTLWVAANAPSPARP